MISNENFPNIKSIIEKTAIQSWSWYHYIFLYAIIPIIILTIPILGIDKFFILDLCQPTFFSIFFNHFYHQLLPHLAGNLVLYLMSITGIIFLEKDKSRFHKMLGYLFLVLPVIASLLYIEFLGNVCTITDSSTTYGFSAVTLGFTGYFIYLFLQSTMPYLFNKTEKLHSSSSIIVRSLTPSYLIFLNFIITIMILIFGIVSGMFIQANNMSLNNGFMHSIGFVTGIFFPMLLELKKGNDLDCFHKVFLINFEALIILLTLYLMFVYCKWIV